MSPTKQFEPREAYAGVTASHAREPGHIEAHYEARAGAQPRILGAMLGQESGLHGSDFQLS